MDISKNWSKQATCFLAVSVFPFWANAQSDEDSEVFELSPFTVESNEGSYTATSTLAGTRIRSNVSDIGSSISILTEQLLDDIGGTDAGSVLPIVPNMEVGGELGNYSAASASESSFQASNTRENLNTTQRVRGLASAQTTRNYFQTVVPFDTYNTSQVTINRGPNSVLFGLGSPGGVIENTISRPTDTDENEVKIRLDAFGGRRATVDLNRVFLDGRLKVRVSAMDEHKKFRQEEAMEDDTRLFGTWDLKLRDAKGEGFLGDTTFRGYLETGDVDRVSPDPIPPSLHYQFWYDISGYQKIVGNYPGYDSIDDIADGYFKTVEQGGSWTPQVTVDNTDRDTYNDTRNLTPAFIALAQIYNSSSAVDPDFGGYDGLMPRIRWGGSRGTQDMKFTLGDWDISGFSAPTLQNREVFDFVNHLYYGDTDEYRDEFDVKEFTLEQSMLNNKIGLEVSFNEQNMENFRYSPYSDGRSRRISIDISEWSSLPVDVPTDDKLAPMVANPNLGRPAMAVNRFSRNSSERDLKTTRATAFFRHDFSDNFEGRWGRILGSHTASALYQDSSDNTLRLGETLNWESDEVDLGGSNILNHGYNQQRRQVQSIVYVGDSVLGTTNPDQIRMNFPLSKSTVPVAGEVGRYTYWDHSAKEVKEVSAYPIWVADSGSNIDEQQVESEAYILQSNWFDNHLVTLFAVRDDTVSNFEMIPEGNIPLDDGGFDLASRRLQSSPSFEQSDRTVTKSFVFKFPEEYLFELPLGADLRVHYFESETFSPSGIGRTLDGSLVSNPNGTTEEYGFSVDMLDQRISLRTSWYETGSNDARIRTSLSNIDGWAGSGGNWLARAAEFEIEGAAVTDIPGNEDGHIASWEDLYEKIMTVTPQSYRDQITIDFDRAGASVQGAGIEGLTSTFDFVSKGMEIELAGALTKNWNIMFNVAKQETVQSNTLPGVREFAEQVEQNLISSGLATLSDAPANAGAQTTFAERWEDNVLFGIRGEQAKDGQKTPEQRKWRWNLVSSYRFNSGVLEGFSVGGVARWQDSAALGYPVVRAEDGNLVNDIANPYYGPTEFNADAWVSYNRTLGEKVDWKIQLNIRNLIGGGDNDFVPISINPLGDVQAWRTSPERQVFVTNTFKF